MRIGRLLMAICALGALPVLSCGSSNVPSAADIIEKCLPPEFSELGLVRDGEITRFAGDSLFYYIDGAAEMYHKYDFVEVHVARYEKDSAGIVADIYRFASGDLAFGMYSTLRPEYPDTVDLGAEGFTFGPVLIFTRGPYMVNIQTYDEAVISPSDIEALADAVNENLPGAVTKPATFGLFPDAGRKSRSEKIIAEAFLGHGFLRLVYTVDYDFDGGAVTFFITDDDSGEKLRRWSEVSANKTGLTGLPSGLPYDNGMAAVLEDRYYGSIVAGVVDGRLAGIVGYTPAYEDALRQWLENLADIDR